MFQVGDGVLYKSCWYGLKRAVIVEVETPQTTLSWGLLLDFEKPETNHHRVWIMREDGRNLKPDPQGPFSPLRPFSCKNQHCHYHSNKGQTALAVCPNCGSEIQKEH